MWPPVNDLCEFTCWNQEVLAFSLVSIPTLSQLHRLWLSNCASRIFMLKILTNSCRHFLTRITFSLSNPEMLISAITGNPIWGCHILYKMWALLKGESDCK